MNKQYGIIIVTASSETEAEAIASALIHENLAACVSITPIKSIYRWQGEINSDPEWQLLIKTDLRLFTNISQKITTIHSYEIPQIIAIPIIEGYPAYLNWLDSNL